MEENWFQKQIREYCPELEDEQIDTSNFSNLLKRSKVINQQRLTNIEVKYLSKCYAKADPN